MDAGAEIMLSHFPDAATTEPGSGAGAGFAADDGGEELVVEGGRVKGRAAVTPVDVDAVVVDVGRDDEVVL